MAGPLPTTTEDIRKMGFLVKIKTNKRKFFVLRDETKSSAARLEYYENEKKFRIGGHPKRTIILKNCFNINPKTDSKHKFAIVLYTKEDCFAVACPTEEEQQNWLSYMIELRSQDNDENTITRPLFEHIWPVIVKSKGLGGSEKKVVPGQYRLCLTNKDLSLFPVNNDQSDIILPLDCIRRCGHAHQFFFLELGRSAKTGSGNLWLQVEDTVIAQNIHEALLSSMKNNEVPAPGVFRFRSGSSATDKPRNRSSMANPAGGGSSSSHTQPPKRSHSIYASNPSSGGATSSSIVDSQVEKSAAKKRPDEYMMITPMTSDQSASQPERGATSVTRTPSEGLAGSENSKSSRSPTRGGAEAAPFQTMKSPILQEVDYVTMSTPAPASDSYMVMSIERADDDHAAVPEEHGSNSSVSSAISSVGSMSIAESSERSFHSLCQLQEVSMADGGYIEMSSPLNFSEQHSLIRPDIVPCYVRDESAEDFPKRAYSVGSKPDKPLNNLYIDMSGKAAKDSEKSSSAPHLNDDDERKRELSDLFMELDFNRSKKDGGHKDLSQRSGKEFRERASSGGSRELRMKAMSFSTKEAIQRLSIFKRNKAVTTAQLPDGRRARTSTICQESLRPRTSSFGPTDARPRSSSGGNACFMDVMSNQLQVGSGQASQDSLRRLSKRLSQESVESGKSDAYLNMNFGKRSTDRLSKMPEGDSGYMDMKPGSDPNADYMRMTSGTSGATTATTTTTTTSNVAVSSSIESTASSGMRGSVLMRHKLETVRAGNSNDYMEMTAEGGSTSQSKAQNTVTSAAPSRPRVTVSMTESSSNYMDMSPGVSSSGEKAIPGNSNSLKADQHKYPNYMEMSLGARKSGTSPGSQNVQPQTRQSGLSTVAEVAVRPETSNTSMAASPKKIDEDKNFPSKQLNTAAVEPEKPPKPFDLPIPSPSFLHYTDHGDMENTPTIPSHTTASRTHSEESGAKSKQTDQVQQISYASLDLHSVDNSNSVADRKLSSSSGRGRGFGTRPTEHVYTQIDFGKSTDRDK